jgi:phosphohistidine phosphatase
VIWLLRHGDAEDGAEDDARPLTTKGKRQAIDAGRALAVLEVKLDACVTSPKVRAVDTARLACGALGIEPQAENALKGGDFDPEQLAADRGEVLLVGHEPDFSNAIARATGGRVKLRKGGLAAIDGRALHFLLRPADLRAIAAGR